MAKTEEKNRGIKAREALDRIKYLLKTGRLSYLDAQHFAEEPLRVLNEESAKISRKHKVAPRKVGFTSYMR